jgi:CRISPR-associated protein Cas1
LHHAARLSKDRGRLVCTADDFKRSLPIENIRAVIIAARGVSFSSAVLSSLTEADAIILHCGPNYQPVAVTAPLVRTINQRILEGQCRPRKYFNTDAWLRVLKAKVDNQWKVCGWIDPDGNSLEGAVVSKAEDEGAIARKYFASYFRALGALRQNRSRRHEGWLNDMLNYGYAVLLALVHRSIVIHGLLPCIGIHHKPRYKATPLVYDLMEPFRPLVDVVAAEFVRHYEEPNMDLFARTIGQGLRDLRLMGPNYSLKMLDWIDLTVRSFATACESQDASLIKLPTIQPNLIANTINTLWRES